MDVSPLELDKMFVSDAVVPCLRFNKRVMERIVEPVRTGPTEISFVSFWDDMVRHVFEYVFDYGFSSRDTNRHSSTGTKGPDFVFTLNTVCVLRGEEKEPSRDIKAARRKLYKKLIWTYGDVPYLFGYAAAGYTMELYAIYQDGAHGANIKQVGQSFYLGECSGRFHLLLALLKICLLLQSIADICPESAHDEFLDINRDSGVVVRMNAVGVVKDYFGASEIFENEATH